ncbi:MAG: NAD(P)-dependent oxidoreductase [Verrucomicrobiales bacterium]|jgi:uronate dehydrogenase|nr:NAD(P)-dependent oxidoreductase [Verrucomicrobiales bacterium]
MRRLLLTGAAGIVGNALRPLLRDHHEQVVLTDLLEIPGDELAENETFLRGDLTDAPFVESLAEDIDGIVHLGGLVGPDFTFDEVMGANIAGTRNVFEAARIHDVPRVVYASSHHALGFLERTDPIDTTTAPRPDSFYGWSKAAGESLGAYYADKFGLKVLSIRIGFVGDSVIDERRLHTWISAQDLFQLVEIGLTHPDLSYDIVYGASDNPAPFFDNENAERLGYEPRDRSIDHLADPALLTTPPAEGPEGKYIGGHFATRTREID